MVNDKIIQANVCSYGRSKNLNVALSVCQKKVQKNLFFLYCRPGVSCQHPLFNCTEKQRLLSFHSF